MKSEDFISMLECFIRKYGLKTSQTDVLVQWNYDAFHVIFNTDCDSDRKTMYLIASTKKVNSAEYGKNEIRPCNFEINEDAMYPERTSLKTISLESIYNDAKNFSEVKLLLASNGIFPKNLICDINPYASKLQRCYNTDKPIIVLAVDKRSEREQKDNPNDVFSLSNLSDVHYWDKSCSDDYCCDDSGDGENFIDSRKLNENL